MPAHSQYIKQHQDSIGQRPNLAHRHVPPLNWNLHGLPAATAGNSQQLHVEGGDSLALKNVSVGWIETNSIENVLGCIRRKPFEAALSIAISADADPSNKPIEYAT